MKRYQLGLAAGCLALVLTGNALVTAGGKGPKVGDSAPDFQSTDHQGKAWKSSDHVGKKIMVVYFFPAALTGG